MKDWLLKFRASRYFLYGLGAFVVIWMGCHFALNWFDPALGNYNSILSTEASLMVSLLLEMQLHNDAKLHELVTMVNTNTERIHDLVQIIVSLTSQEAKDIEAIEETLEEIQDDIHNPKANR